MLIVMTDESSRQPTYTRRPEKVTYRFPLAVPWRTELSDSMIVEVRKYTIKPGLRAKFVEFFETRTAPAQREEGMQVLGPLLDLENPDVFVWLRGFPSLEDRDRMKAAFYEGPLWTQEFEAIAMPMLERYEVILTETSSGFVTFPGDAVP